MATSDTFHPKFDEICRLCLKQEGFLSSIFETNEPEDAEPLLKTRIASIAPVQIDPEDGLPDLICHTCRNQVEKSYNFRLLVELSDRTLRACLDTEKTTESDELVVKQEAPAVNEKYQQFLLDNNLTDSDIDSSAVSVILVQTENGTQVLNICSVNEEENMENTEDDTEKMHYEDNDQDIMEENCQDPNDSDIDDVEGIQRFLKVEKMDNAASPQPIMRLIGTREKLTSVVLVNENCMVDEEEDQEEDPLDQEGDEEEKQESVPELNCQLCSETFRSLLDLKNHISQHFAKGRICESIGEPESPEEEVEEAQEAVEDPEEGFERVTDGDLKTEEDENEEGGSLMNCDIECMAMKEEPKGDDDLPSASRTVWKMSKAVKAQDSSFRCTKCGKKFSRSSSLKTHERIHKNDVIFICAVCGKCFTKKSDLKYHEGSHAEKPPECAVCKKLFLNMQSFKMHMKRHVLGCRYACSYCGKRYYTNSELSRHVQTHLGKRAFPCDQCETSFLSQPELNRHLKYHNGEKKFTCKVCFKSYFESGHLKIHERVHTGEKPFACMICSKAFFTKPKLVRHMKTHVKHQGDKGEVSEELRRNEDALETIM